MADVPAPPFAAKRKTLRGHMAQQIDMFDRLADPLLQVTRRKGRIKWANQATAKLLGDKLINHRLTEVFASKDLKAALKQLRKGEISQRDLIVSAKNFPDREFRARLVGLERKTLYGARVLVSLTEITEVMRLQKQRADFVANASHELKTPIAALSGFIETLEQDPKALEAFLPLMSTEAARMRALIRDLLSLTRTEMEQSEPPTEAQSLQPLLDQAVQSIQANLERRLQKLDRKALPEGALVRADATALTTVFINLLQNASKYAPEATTIEIEPEIEGGSLLIHFRNAGKGIEAKHIPRLTERFYRIEDSRTPKAGGTGLGLAIVKHVLIRHKGALKIASKPDQGATFTVVLPLHQPRPA